MDIQTLLHNLHEELSCSVCMATFTDPKQLPCLHSFCLHCLIGIQRTSGRHDKITCPECRRESRVPSSGNLKDLPTDFRINSLLDVLAIRECSSIGPKCGNCDKRSAKSFYCFQCLAFWCNDCITVHNLLRGYKQHRVLALTDMRHEDIADVLNGPTFCQKKYHEKEELKFFCKDCVLAVCNKCVTTLHNGHGLVELEEAANDRKLEITSSIATLKKKVSEKRNRITELIENCIEIQERTASVKRQVQIHCKNMIQLIEIKEQDMLAEVEFQAEQLLERIGKQIAETETSAIKIEASAKTTESLLKRSSDADLANFCLDQLADDEAENPDDSCPSDLPDLTFVENQRLLHVINSEDIGLFVVAFKKTEARHSIAKGKGIHEAVVGVEAQFILSTRNAQGRLCHGNLDIITVDITNNQGQDCAEEVRIQDNKDGTYEIYYLVWQVDEYSVAVKLNGEHIPGSPFALYVKGSQLKVRLPPLGSSGLANLLMKRSKI